MHIDELDLSVRSYNVLSRAGITTTEQIEKMTDDELRAVSRMSEKCVKEIREAVQENGFMAKEYKDALVDTISCLRDYANELEALLKEMDNMTEKEISEKEGKIEEKYYRKGIDIF